ncbi:Double zinc ribbon [Butyricicoccus pullicaecorum DSM 23266]|uniref:DZANK-type domain-containing protein n=2 Tax=Butyricicoccus pullicaecorum TaxID=501571 RepID=R8VS22_9FIRM|nr:hypothetical protein HMPREF1526_03022 [Butyricicoccus pullicaecorum 1.2]SKA67673.1 Double zinc ribbon [Butyricicoccus pullicaecorum DSM 23266]
MPKEQCRRTADYEISVGPDGYYFRFYCAISGALLCTVGPVRGDTRETALQTAWQTEGRSLFNQCHKCGRWVSDVMYNADTLECVECSPWKPSLNFCPHCGAKLCGTGSVCHKCGMRLMEDREREGRHQKIRRMGMEQYGFGPDAMKKIKVCRICGAVMSGEEDFCTDCGAILPKETLFDLYKTMHFYCPACSTVLADTASFCPQCGKRLRYR